MVVFWTRVGVEEMDSHSGWREDFNPGGEGES